MKSTKSIRFVYVEFFANKFIEIKNNAINALLVAAGHNMRLILNALAFWLAWIMSVTAKAAKTAKMDTLKPLNQYQISMA